MNQFVPERKVSERGKTWVLRSSWRPSSLPTPVEGQLWDQRVEGRKMRGKSRTVHNSLGMPLPLLVLFPPCDHQWQLSSPGQDLVTPCHGVPVPPLGSHLACNTKLALPFPLEWRWEAKGYTGWWALPGSFCSLVCGWILTNERHAWLCDVIFYTDHAQTREQKRCVCSSSIRNTKTLFWWIICLLRKAQLNFRNSTVWSCK